MGFGTSWKNFKSNLFSQSKEGDVLDNHPVPEESFDMMVDATAVDATNSNDDTVAALKNCLAAMHGFSDPKKISYYVMKGLREYYEADFVCVMEINFDLDYWFMRWASREGYDDIEETDIKDLIQPGEYIHYARTWMRAFVSNKPVLIEDVEAVRESSPAEYALYKRLEAESIMGCPFYKHSKGFAIARNPKKHIGDFTLLQLCSYVLMMELNEYKMLESLRLQAENFMIRDEHEVRLELFDGVKITHIGGQYTAENFTPDQKIVLTYMAFYPKTISSREMEREIWEEYEEALQEGQKVRRAINGVVNKCTLLKYPLIFRDDNGYKFHPDLKVIIDVREYMRLFEQSKHVADISAQKQMLIDLIGMYKGPIREEAKTPGWMNQAKHHMESIYLTVVKRLLHIYFNEGDYESLHRYANKSMKMVANNTEGYYWKIRAYRKTMLWEKANSLLETAKKCIPDEEYTALNQRLEMQDDLDPDHVF